MDQVGYAKRWPSVCLDMNWNDQWNDRESPGKTTVPPGTPVWTGPAALMLGKKSALGI